MNDLFTRIGETFHRLSLFALLLALGITFWGFRPTPRTPRPEHDQTPPPYALVIDTTGQRATLFRGNELLAVFPCGIAGGKSRRLPTGSYRLHHQRADPVHGRAFAMAYPSVELAQRAHKQKWINQRELGQILEAHRFGLLPPQDTRLGPSPLIVGGGRDAAPRGAIALDDEDLERLTPFLRPGTIIVLRQ